MENLVSVIIPTYKRSEMLIRAVQSALKQTYDKIEVIVVDDNDFNDEFSLLVQASLSEISDIRLRYIQQEKHINGAVARNVGICNAKGNYIAFLDDDDEWLPNKIETQKQLLDNLKDEYGAVSCLALKYKNGLLFSKDLPYSEENLHMKVLKLSVSIHTDTVLYRKKCLDDAGYFNEALLRNQDVQLFLDFLVKYKIKLIPEYLINIHIDDGQNRPNTAKIISVKEMFFKSMRKHFDIYSRHIQKRLYASHYFEIVLVALREKKIGIALKYLLKINFNFFAYYDLLKKINLRQKTKIKY